MNGMVNSPNVFITDASYKHTLGVVRSLGRKGITVYCGSSSYLPSLCSFSRYVKQTLIYPDPKAEPELFSTFVKKASKKFNCVIPMGYNTNYALSKHKDIVNDLRLPITDFESFRIAASKKETVLLAEKLNIPVPATMIPEDWSDLEKKDFRYPLVVKGSLESGFVRYAYNLGELKEKVREIQRLQGEYPLIQEYIPGVGFGFFGLFNKGELRALFMHKRVREYPVKGGPSTCAKSVFEPKLLDYIIKLFKALKWHGIVMVEFRRDVRDEEFKLMEINPKFWGSLDLAIASGVDFPYLLYKMAVEGDVEPSFRYKIGVRFLWPFPDDFQRIIEKPLEIKSFLSDLFNPIVEKNISFSDMTPNLIQLIETVYLTARKL